MSNVLGPYWLRHLGSAAGSPRQHCKGEIGCPLLLAPLHADLLVSLTPCLRSVYSKHERCLLAHFVLFGHITRCLLMVLVHQSSGLPPCSAHDMLMQLIYIHM